MGGVAQHSAGYINAVSSIAAHWLTWDSIGFEPFSFINIYVYGILFENPITLSMTSFFL